ncbi:hypothetical protein NLU03_23980 [Bacillus toyonensis]|nr:hypothetical protein [Bacillus toyonensis]MDT3497351.1 hypothetical protein [Bacillus toyonensis]
MSNNSCYHYITVKEFIFIYTCVTGKEILTLQALQILKQFAFEKIQSANKQSRQYGIRKNGEELFEYYRKKHAKLFDKQKLYTYEELKHRAVYDYSSYLTIHL